MLFSNRSWDELCIRTYTKGCFSEYATVSPCLPWPAWWAPPARPSWLTWLVIFRGKQVLTFWNRDQVPCIHYTSYSGLHFRFFCNYNPNYSNSGLCVDEDDHLPGKSACESETRDTTALTGILFTRELMTAMAWSSIKLSDGMVMSYSTCHNLKICKQKSPIQETMINGAIPFTVSPSAFTESKDWKLSKTQFVWGCH